MQTHSPEKMLITVEMPIDLVRRVDLLAASMQQQSGPVRRISRSAAVRSVLERHLAAAPAAPIVPPRPVRVRSRKDKG